MIKVLECLVPKCIFYLKYVTFHPLRFEDSRLAVELSPSFPKPLWACKVNVGVEKSVVPVLVQYLDIVLIWGIFVFVFGPISHFSTNVTVGGLGYRGVFFFYFSSDAVVLRAKAIALITPEVTLHLDF